jgi:hypothetical protein
LREKEIFGELARIEKFFNGLHREITTKGWPCIKIEGAKKGVRIGISKGRGIWHDIEQDSVTGRCKTSRTVLVRNRTGKR